MEKRRIGGFELENKFLYNNYIQQKVASLFNVMDFIPLKVENLGYKDATRFIGISPLFEEIEVGQNPFFYNLVIVHSKDNSLIEEVKAVKYE